MTATTRLETPLLPPKDRRGTNLPFSGTKVLVPTRMNDSESFAVRMSDLGRQRGGAPPQMDRRPGWLITTPEANTSVKPI